MSGIDLRAEYGDYYRWHYPRLVGFLQVLGASVDQAAEVAQQAMAELFRQWRQVVNRRAWTCRVAVRLLAGPVLPRSPLVRERAAGPGILSQVAALPPRQRHVMAWKLMEFAPAEIAVELRLSEDTVRAELARARKALRPSFAGKGAAR